VEFRLRKKKTHAILKTLSKEDKTLIRKEKSYGTKRLLAEFPNKHLPFTTVKHLQQKIDGNITVNRQLGSGRKRKVIRKKYNITSVTCCFFLIFAIG